MILPDESIVAVGIDYIEVVIGDFHVYGKYDFEGEVRTFKFEFNHQWHYTSIKELENVIQQELSRELEMDRIAAVPFEKH